MTSQSTPVVTTIGQIHFEGNIIPHTWYQHLRTKMNTPHTTAIIILSEIIYWYRPVEDRDEQTGRLLGFHKKFKGEMYQRNYERYADQFGFTKGQVKSAFDYLREKGLVRTEFKSFTSETGLYLSNVMYAEPIPEAIARINLPIQEDETYDQGVAAIPTMGMQVPPGSMGEDGVVVSPAGGTYTEIPLETPLEIPTEIHTSRAKPPARSVPPNGGGGHKPPASVPKPTRAGKLTPEQQATQNRLMHVFMDESEIHSLPSKFSSRNESWFKPLRRLAEACAWDEDAAADLIRDTIRDMNKRGLDMKCPASIENNAIGIKRRSRGEADDFKGAWREL